MSIEEGGRLIYDLDFEDNKDKPMRSLGLVDGKRITISTLSDEDSEKTYSIVVFINHRYVFIMATFIFRPGNEISMKGDKKLEKKSVCVKIDESVETMNSLKRKVDDSVINITEDDGICLIE